MARQLRRSLRHRGPLFGQSQRQPLPRPQLPLHHRQPQQRQRLRRTLGWRRQRHHHQHDGRRHLCLGERQARLLRRTAEDGRQRPLQQQRQQVGVAHQQRDVPAFGHKPVLKLQEPRHELEPECQRQLPVRMVPRQHDQHPVPSQLQPLQRQQLLRQPQRHLQQQSLRGRTDRPRGAV